MTINIGDDGGDLSTVDASDGTWVVVPLVYGRTVYGALGLYTGRSSIGEREREVLAELGETVGYAIDAVETRWLLSAEEVVELELEGTDPTARSSRSWCWSELLCSSVGGRSAIRRRSG